MKVSNRNIARITAYSLLIMTTIVLVGILLINKTLYDSILIAVVILMIVIITKIRIVIYEFSGSCVTIRKTHPFSFKKFISPTIEFPQNYIHDYNVNHHIFSGSLVLKLKSKRNKKNTVKIKLFGFTYAQRQKISTSLFSVVSKNNFKPARQ